MARQKVVEITGYSEAIGLRRYPEVRLEKVWPTTRRGTGRIPVTPIPAQLRGFVGDAVDLKQRAGSGATEPHRDRNARLLCKVP